MRQRIEEILRIRLDGAEFWDVREYAREKEVEKGSAWERPAGGKPLSDGQLWRYIGRADKLIAESCRASRKKLLRNHLSQRRNLYAKAVAAGDYRTALSIIRDEAELLALYPAKGIKLGGQDGGPLILHIVEEVTRRESAADLGEITEEVITANDHSSNPALPGDPPAPGTAGLRPV